MKFVVVMPFDKAFDPIYSAIKSGVQMAVPESVCIRVDHDLAAGRITAKIRANLHSADICIADITPDMTQYKPNIMWEVGFIEALHKPLIVVSQSVDNFPFNIQDLSVLLYSSTDLESKLTRPLRASIEQTLPSLGSHHSKLTVAITGSRTITTFKALSAVQSYAAPFLSSETTWYCGTNSPVDEAAARFLLAEGQQVTGIYTMTNTVSSSVRALFTEHKASLVDADNVQLPIRHPELSRRDAFFAA
jgi:hypothetical protein